MIATVDIDRPASIAVYTLSVSLGLMALALAPMLVGAYIEQWGYTEQQAALLIACELYAYAAGSALAFTLVHRVDWRTLVASGIVVLAAAHAATAFWHSHLALLALRCTAGIGGGLLVSMTIVVIGRTRMPERNFAFWQGAQLACGAAGLALLGPALPHVGLARVFAALAVLTATLLASLRSWPRGMVRTRTDPGAVPAAGRHMGLAALSGAFLTQMGFWAVWPYAERIGLAAAIDAATIATALVGAQLAGLAGCAAAAVVGVRLGRTWPVSLGVAIGLIATAVLALGASAGPLAAGFALTMFALFYSQPYVGGSIAALDTDGRLLAAFSVVLPLAIPSGVALATPFIAKGSYAAVYWIMAAALPTGFALLYPATRAQRAADRAGTAGVRTQSLATGEP